MEPSPLPPLSLCGIIVSLGGTFFALAILFPAARATFEETLTCELQQSVARWIFIGALVGALAAGLNLFVDVAEVRNRTVFGGLNFLQAFRFGTLTTVGQLTLG